LLANTDEPNGLPPPRALGRCGMEPARSLESSAWLLELEAPELAC
jgi:hypothetical protein